MVSVFGAFMNTELTPDLHAVNPVCSYKTNTRCPYSHCVSPCRSDTSCPTVTLCSSTELTPDLLLLSCTPLQNIHQIIYCWYTHKGAEKFSVWWKWQGSWVLCLLPLSQTKEALAAQWWLERMSVLQFFINLLCKRKIMSCDDKKARNVRQACY